MFIALLIKSESGFSKQNLRRRTRTLSSKDTIKNSWNQGSFVIKDILLGKSPVFTIGVRLVGSVQSLNNNGNNRRTKASTGEQKEDD